MARLLGVKAVAVSLAVPNGTSSFTAAGVPKLPTPDLSPAHPFCKSEEPNKKCTMMHSLVSPGVEIYTFYSIMFTIP